MPNNTYQTIGILLLALTALILYLNKNRSVTTYAALGVLLVLVLLFPFAGLLVSVPIALQIWLSDSDVIWETWNRLKSHTIGGNGE